MTEAPTTTPTTPAPRTGGFQQIDGRSVFAHRMGGGGPAVVFLPGAGAVGLDYLAVQQRVARFATAVVYDRGGTGWSDPVPLPRTAAAVAAELRALLTAMGIAAPYVLAAHSLGGCYAHRFAQLYPRAVAGLVWLDAVGRDWDEFLPVEGGLAAMERSAPGLAQSVRMRPALREMHAELLADHPAELRDALLEAKLSDAWLRSGVAERSGLTRIAAELGEGPAIPDIPLVALTVAEQDAPAAVVAGKTRMHAALAASVTGGQHRVVAGTAHHRLCVDCPDVVASAVRRVVERAGG